MTSSKLGLNRLSACSICAFALAGSWSIPATQAGFARPPEPSPYQPIEQPIEPLYPVEPERRYGPDERELDLSDELAPTSSSSVRFQIGPALLLEPSSPGLFTALDFGQRAVGARVSAAWLRTKSEQGLSAYTAEIWIDFRHRYQLHPILGAGASWVHGRGLGEPSDIGAGVLRGALEYELPIRDADARIGVSALALVPAIGAERTKPWVTLALGVGVGF